MRSARRRFTWLALMAVAAVAGCSRSEPLTPQASAAKGDALLRQMSKTLAGSQALAVTADEMREQVLANGQKRQNSPSERLEQPSHSPPSMPGYKAGA